MHIVKKAALAHTTVENNNLLCDVLTLPGHQVPTQAAPSLPSSGGQERENITEVLLVEIRTGRDIH